MCFQCFRSSALCSTWLITSVAGTAAGMLSEVHKTLIWSPDIDGYPEEGLVRSYQSASLSSHLLVNLYSLMSSVFCGILLQVADCIDYIALHSLRHAASVINVGVAPSKYTCAHS